MSLSVPPFKRNREGTAPKQSTLLQSFSLASSPSTSSIVKTQPKPKLTTSDIVHALMERKREKIIKNNKEYFRLQCLNPKCNGKVVEVQCKKGLGNALVHLKSKSCYGGLGIDLETIVHGMNETGKEASELLEGCFDDETKHMYHYLKMVTELELPLNACKKEIYRKQSKHRSKLYEKKVREGLFKLTRVVERKIGEAMKSARIGALMSDAWTKFGYHYLALLGIFTLKDQTRTVLLSCSPLPGGRRVVDSEDENDDNNNRILHDIEGEDACIFTKEKHVEFFQQTFEYYLPNITNIKDWAVVHIADNHPINYAISKVLEIKNIGCYNHRLHLDVAQSLEHRVGNPNNSIVEAIESCNNTMKDCKLQMKSRSVLRSKTDLVAKIGVTNRWSSTYNMIVRFNRIYNDLRETYIHPDTNVHMDLSEGHKQLMIKIQKFLQPVAFATKELQTKHYTLAQGMSIIDELKSIMLEHEQTYNIQLSLQRVSFELHNNRFVGDINNYYFQSGVRKIQEGKTMQMTDVEKQCCEVLLRRNNNNEVEDKSDDGDESHDGSDNEDIIERLRAAGQRNIARNDEEYVNCDFILASSAEVERLWSLAARVLSLSRASMFPITLEAIIFLKYNSEWWGMADVQEALRMSDEELCEEFNEAIEEDNDEEDE